MKLIKKKKKKKKKFSYVIFNINFVLEILFIIKLQINFMK